MNVMLHFENHRLQWDDLRLILYVARAGSFAGAAGMLGVSTPTVFRKAKSLEARLGTLVFRRDNTGVTLTAAGREAAALAERFAGEVATLEARIGDADTDATGTIRFATVDTLVAGPADAGADGVSRRVPADHAGYPVGRRHGELSPARGRCRPQGRGRAR